MFLNLRSEFIAEGYEILIFLTCHNEHNLIMYETLL